MRRAAAALAVAVALGLLGCGGGDTEGTAPTAAAAGRPEGGAAPGAYVESANRVCKRMLRETRQLGRRFVARLSRSQERDPVAAQAEALIAPGVAVLERTARSLRAVEGDSPGPRLSAYIDLYDPLLQLGHLLLAAAEAEDLGEAKNLEGQMEAVGEEQRQAARAAGLGACGRDFLHVLVAQWTR